MLAHASRSVIATGGGVRRGPVVDPETAEQGPIEARVIEVIRRHLQASEAPLDPRTRFVDDLGADSLALAELTLVFEETFDIDISDEDAENLRTVRDAIVSVQRSLLAKNAG